MTKIVLSTMIDAPIHRVFDLSRSVEVHQLSTSKTDERAIAGRTSGLFELGDEVTWSAKHFGIYQMLSTKITKLKPPFYFQDCMLQGAFQFFIHDHYFSEDRGTTTVKEVFEYGVPYGIAGKIFDVLVLKSYMTKFLSARNAVIKHVAENEDRSIKSGI